MGAAVFEMASQPMTQQDFWVSRSRGANSRVVINWRGCNFYWLLNTELKFLVATADRHTCGFTAFGGGSGKWYFSEAE